LKLSSVPFCHGFPGSMMAVSMPALVIQRRMARETNSGPLSDRRYWGGAVHADEAGEHVDDAPGPDAAGDLDRQAFARPLVDNRQALERLPVRTRVEEEVVRPDLIRRGRRRRTRPARRHAAPRPLPGHLEASLPPQAIQAVGTHPQVGAFQEDEDPAIAIPRILPG
jgi:hypothetical protein